MNPIFDCVVVANGLFPSNEKILALLKDAPFIIACDGAALSLVERGYRVDAVVGDMDSLPEELKQKFSANLYHLAEQMSNDLTKAVRFAHGRGYKNLLILGATGLREDHTLGNISLLTEYIGMFDYVQMISDFGVFIPLKQTTTLSSIPGQQISIFSIIPQAKLTTEGLKWEVTDRSFECWWQGTLNEAVGEKFTISFNGEARVVIYKAFRD